MVRSDPALGACCSRFTTTIESRRNLTPNEPSPPIEAPVREAIDWLAAVRGLERDVVPRSSSAQVQGRARRLRRRSAHACVRAGSSPATPVLRSPGQTSPESRVRELTQRQSRSRRQQVGARHRRSCRKLPQNIRRLALDRRVESSSRLQHSAHLEQVRKWHDLLGDGAPDLNRIE